MPKNFSSSFVINDDYKKTSISKVTAFTRLYKKLMMDIFKCIAFEGKNNYRLLCVERGYKLDDKTCIESICDMTLAIINSMPIDYASTNS